MPSSPIPVICVCGATGTGKSAAAVSLAERFRGAVINADSRQVYTDFPIITAQPGDADTSRCPHLLYGFLGCREKLGAGAYAELAGKEIADLHHRGTVPILTGGTGLYLRTLFRGIAPIPPVDPAISRAWAMRLKEEGAAALHRVLETLDPGSAAKLHPNDSQRITRALEVLEGTGKPLGYWHSLPVPPSPYRTLLLYLDLDLAALTPRLARRIDAMIDAGAVDEARRALAACPDPVAPGWSGIGCSELYRYLQGEIDLPACRELWLRNTRAYAKRQITWFRAERDKTAFDPRDIPGMLEAAAAFLCKQ